MMAQHLVDAYEALPPAERASVDALLGAVGGDEAVDYFARRTLLGGCPRLERREFKLWPLLD